MTPFLSLVQKRIRAYIDRKPVLGLDFGRTGVKALLLERIKDRKEPLVRFSFYPDPVDADDAVSIQTFRAFLKRERLDRLEVACNIDDPSLKIRSVDLPKMPASDIREALKWQLRDIIEDSVDHYAIRHTLLQEYKAPTGGRLVLIVYAIHREAVEKRTRLLSQLSLKPRLIEPTPVALLSCMDRILPWENEVVYGLLELGEGHSSFVAVADRKLLFSRPLLEVSGEELSRMILRELRLSESESRDLKKGLLKTSSLETVDERLKSILPLFYSKIAIEVQRSLDGFSLLFQQGGKIGTIFLCGGGSILPSLSEFLTKNVGIRIDRVDPLQGWDIAAGDHHLYFVSAGLALCGGGAS